MESVPAIIVKKGGFLSALAYGLFGLLTTSVVCASGLGFYAMWIAHTRLDRVFKFGEGIVAALPQWQEALPPALSDALNDRRDPAYRNQVEVSVRLLPDRRRDEDGRAVIEVRNTGPETISFMTLRVLVEDEQEAPEWEFTTFVATPLAIDECDWRGPLLPGSTRKFIRHVDRPVEGRQASAEVSELRVWTGPTLTEEAGQSPSRLRQQTEPDRDDSRP